MENRQRAVVTRFGPPEVIEIRTEPLGPVQRGHTRVRVTHASVGSTDLLARSGGYLLQRRPGFTPGYDLIGETGTGRRVAVCLPYMGAHATIVDVPDELLVDVPDGLDPVRAAALPLDLLTAGRALELAGLPERGTLLVNGISGNVGRVIAALARRRGHTVVGTASRASAGIYDYRDPQWIKTVRRETGGVDAVVDHTGRSGLGSLLKSGGVVVRVSFVGRPGHEPRDTAIGGLRATLSPRQRLVTVPAFVGRHPDRYRQLLAELLAQVAAGELPAPFVRVMPFSAIVEAHRRVSSDAKTVLAFPDAR